MKVAMSRSEKLVTARSHVGFVVSASLCRPTDGSSVHELRVCYGPGGASAASNFSHDIFCVGRPDIFLRRKLHS